MGICCSFKNDEKVWSIIFSVWADSWTSWSDGFKFAAAYLHYINNYYLNFVDLKHSPQTAVKCDTPGKKCTSVLINVHFFTRFLIFSSLLSPPALFPPSTHTRAHAHAHPSVVFFFSHDFVSCVKEVCESRGGRPWFPVPKNPCGLCGRESTLEVVCLFLHGLVWIFIPNLHIS